MSVLCYCTFLVGLGHVCETVLKEESNPEGTVHAHPNYPTVYRCVLLAFGWPFGARGLSRAAAANTPDETPEHWAGPALG